MSRPVVAVQYTRTRQPTRVIRVGTCNNCGVCCQLYNKETGRYEYCQHYDPHREKHCTIWHKRPKMCREWPRGPMDILNKPECSYQFYDEHGRKIDAYMDPRVRLQRLGAIPEEAWPFKNTF